jgi:hypothetical protein
LGGKVKDYLMKNPSAINYLLPMLQGFLGKQGIPALSGSQKRSEGGFELR